MVSNTNNLREPSLPELEIPSPPASSPPATPPATPSLDNPWTVITRTCPVFSASLVKSYNGLTGIRAQNIHSGLNRIPAGFYVLVQFDGSQRRTQNKSIRLSDSGIEWEDEILL